MSEIVKLLKEGESEEVEFKPSLSQMDKILECISAFSNTRGGIIVVGVSDKGKVLGVDIGKRTIENLVNTIKQNIRLFGFRTEYSFQRIDKLEYPIKAIRECIINALIHRNYFEPADTRVAIYDDRIEIISPGTFPEGVTPEEPKHVPVNPILCQLMYDVGFIEKYGSGIYMINEL
jgi:ATP-dependent DNA helicase RecG